MEYADGGCLCDEIKNSEPPNYWSQEKVLDYFVQICLAIKHAHDRKILHRDIKSENIFMTKEGIIKVGDFGVSFCLNSTSSQAGTRIGTPYYLSPEIIDAKPYSFENDVWSIGVILYEMCILQ